MTTVIMNAEDAKGMKPQFDSIEKLCDVVRQIAYDIHKYLGVGYLEKVYENALCHRLEKAGLSIKRQVQISVKDEDGFPIGEYVADVIVENIILELKAVSTINQAHIAQTLNYLKATGLKHAILINFGSVVFQCRKLAF